MLIGFVLVAVGIALIGYVAIPRPSRTRRSGRRELGLVATGAPPIPAASDPIEDPADTAETQVIRIQPSLSDAVLLDPSDVMLIPPAVESEPRRADPKVVVAYEAEAEAEENTSPVARISVTASGDTDCGQQRRANDDNLLVLPEHCLFAVADGMGGYAGGSVASRLAVDAMQRAFEEGHFVGELRSASPVPRGGRELASSIIQAHAAVASQARTNREHSQMGTTLVAARFSLNQQRVYIANVGDSRCYRFRGGRLRQLTCDQTMASVGLSGPHAEDLLQAVGVTPSLSIDLVVDEPRAGDVYLLCSDGLHKMVSDSQISRAIAAQRNLEAAVYDLIELANDAGGQDNITVVLIRVRDHGADLATIPSPPPDSKGWSTVPKAATSACSSEDDTVVGGLAELDLRALKLEPSRSSQRRNH